MVMYKCSRGVEPGATSDKSSQWSEREHGSGIIALGFVILTSGIGISSIFHGIRDEAKTKMGSGIKILIVLGLGINILGKNKNMGSAVTKKCTSLRPSQLQNKPFDVVNSTRTAAKGAENKTKQTKTRAKRAKLQCLIVKYANLLRS